MKPNRAGLITGAKYLLGFVVLGFVVRGNWHAPPNAPGTGLADAWTNLRWPPLIPAAVCLMIGLALTLVRWWVLARALDLPLSLREATRLGLLGYFFNSLLPGGIGGDAVKIASVVRSQDRRTAAVFSIIFDRLVGLGSIVLITALVGGAYWSVGWLSSSDKLFTLVRGAWIATAVSLIGWFALGFLPVQGEARIDHALRRIPKLGGVLAELLGATWTYRRRPAAVTYAILLSLLNHVVAVFAFFCAAHVGAPDSSELPTLAQHYMLVPAGLVVKAVFPAPGGAGGGEWSFGKLYELAGQPASLGVLASIVNLALSWLLGIGAYFIALRMGAKNATPP
ncbi:MAG: flippase-like domain-containing protein [Gemmataceae bacterium]|nr:flippase-like domain-containing protein [Gemmataceae bacterium]